MNPAVQKLALFFVDLVLPLGIGYVLASRERARRFLDRAMKANIVTLVPALTALSLWTLQLRREDAWIPVLGIAMQLVPACLAYPWARARYDDPLRQGSFTFATMLSNRGTVGVLTVFLLYGEQGFAYAQLVILLAPAVNFGLCFPWAQRFHARRHGTDVERPRLAGILFSPNMVPAVGVIVGFLLKASPWSRPDSLGRAVPLLLHLMIWLFIVPLGASIDFGEMRRYWRDVLALSPVKFAFTPAVIYLLSLLVGISGVGRDVTVILAFSPTAILAVVTSKLFDLDVHMAMAAFVMTTVLYLVFVLPVILLIFG